MEKFGEARDGRPDDAIVHTDNPILKKPPRQNDARSGWPVTVNLRKEIQAMAKKQISTQSLAFDFLEN